MSASMFGSPILKLSDSERLPKDADGPVFAEPWEAQAFAMAVTLNEAGVFSWREWAEALAAELKAEPIRPYYESWLLALETLLEAKQVMSERERLERVATWERAAKATPHGQPVELSRG
jgi:nitrile hydratase accessory protein